MIRKAIVKGTKIGAIAGFVSALLYAMLALVVVEAQLPISNPSINVIFTSNFFKEDFPFLLPATPIWLLIPIIMGSITAGTITFVISKFHLSRKTTIFICFLLSTIVASPLLILYKLMSFGIDSGSAYHSILEPNLQIRLLLLFPSMIYIFGAIVTGQYLYNSLITKSDDASLERGLFRSVG